MRMDLKNSFVYGIAGAVLLCSYWFLNTPKPTEEPQQATETAEAEPEEVFTGEPYHILCFGDSNTWGYDAVTEGRFPKEKRWPTILQENLGMRYEVTPDGMNGRCTIFCNPGYDYTCGLDTLPAELAANHPVDMIIFMLGTNDCIFSDFYEINEETVAYGMEQIIKKVEEKSDEIQGFEPEMIIVVPGALRKPDEQTIREVSFKESGREYSEKLAPLYEDIANRHHCGFIDGTELLEVSPLDCVHLTENGQKTLADLLTDYLQNKAKETEKPE